MFVYREEYYLSATEHDLRDTMEEYNLKHGLDTENAGRREQGRLL